MELVTRVALIFSGRQRSRPSALGYGGRRAWSLPLIVIFMVLLGSAGIVAWRHDNAQKSATIVSQSQEERAAPSYTAAPINASDQNAIATYTTPTPLVSEQFDPFKASLEAHGGAQLAQPVPQNPQAIQDTFKEAVKRQQAASMANPFATARNPDIT